MKQLVQSVEQHSLTHTKQAQPTPKNAEGDRTATRLEVLQRLCAIAVTCPVEIRFEPV